MKKFILLLMFVCSTIGAWNGLVRIADIDPTIAIELIWADSSNFMGEAIYPACAQSYAQHVVALELSAIQKELSQRGLGIKIRDAFRPMWAQKRLWEIVQTMNLSDPGMYISDPILERGRHTRGTAIDLTLIRLSDGQELTMPPLGFLEAAHQNYYGPELTQEQIANRELLKEVMMRHGFTPIKSEWWHFDYKNWRDYTPLDITFEELEQLVN